MAVGERVILAALLKWVEEENCCIKLGIWIAIDEDMDMFDKQ